MRVLVSGASGLVGSALVPFLSSSGCVVIRLVRSKSQTGESAAFWDPESGLVDAARLRGHDAVVHLAGESIGAGRWTAKKKGRIRESRVRGTRLLAESLARLPQPPKVLLCASAVGFYGDRGDEILTEQSARGRGFLADVCQDWEAVTRSALAAGIRVVRLRFGMILAASGGALARIAPIFHLGLGGRLGGGQQWMSWIALHDAVGAIVHALQTSSLSGAVNAVSPNPVRNAEFTTLLGKALRRPAVFAVPRFAARLLLGEMAEELLLSSARVVPEMLTRSGYVFSYPHLEAALWHLLHERRKEIRKPDEPAGDRRRGSPRGGP